MSLEKGLHNTDERWKQAMKKCKGNVAECRGYKSALVQICDIFNGWRHGDFAVFAADNADVDEDNTFTLDYRLAAIHNIALAALGRPELVPGIPEQSFNVIFPTDQQLSLDCDGYDEEPEVY